MTTVRGNLRRMSVPTTRLYGDGNVRKCHTPHMQAVDNDNISLGGMPLDLYIDGRRSRKKRNVPLLEVGLTDNGMVLPTMEHKGKWMPSACTDGDEQGPVAADGDAETVGMPKYA